MDGVGVREFAKAIGKSHVWVMKLLKAGAIPRNDDGTIPMKAGLEAYERYQGASREERKKQVFDNPEPPKRQKKEQPKPSRPEPSPLPNPQEMSNFSTAMNKAKLAETTFKARLRELEYKLKNGDLIPKDDVSREASWMAEQVKAKLMAIPPRISSMCEGRVAREIEEIISDSINGALKELQKCKYSGDEE